MLLPYLRIISEQASLDLDRHLNKMEDWINTHAGDDLVRWLHAQDVEIVARSTGAIIKCYRNDTEYSQEDPQDNWNFFAGRYEIDAGELESSSMAKSITKAPGFTHRDYYYAIKHIIDMHKKGKLKDIPQKTLIVLQSTGNEELPEVRSYRTKPTGRCVVVGVKYDVDPQWVENILRFDRPNDITRQALQKQQQWESHSQVQKIADDLDTDSMPLFFRGRLHTTDRAISGLEKSVKANVPFKNLVQNFFQGLPQDATQDDYEKLFRDAVNKFGDLEIHVLDQNNKIKDATLVTRSSLAPSFDRIQDRYQDVAANIKDTIEKYGESSPEHNDEFKNTSYVRYWIRDQIHKYLFAEYEDPVSTAITMFKENKIRPDKRKIMNWIERELMEQGVQGSLYRDHLRDTNVPEGRMWAKTKLWTTFLQEIETMLAGKIDELIHEIGAQSQGNLQGR